MGKRATPDTEDRARARAAFLAAQGWGQAACDPLPGDASFRRYFRLSKGGQGAILMDAPPPDEDVRPFIRIARHLCGLGYSAPGLMGADAAAGFLLLEDLGNGTFTRLLMDGASEARLYELATDLLIDLHRRPHDAAVPPGLAPYDEAAFLREAALFIDYYVPAALGGAVSGAARAAYLNRWQAALGGAYAVPRTLVLRDFHVDNLMHLPGRTGLAACGLLDFQDALDGPVTYDLMSLLEDARRDVPDHLAKSLRARYLAAFPALDRAAFDRSFAILAAQRHCKVIGIFTRLCVRDGKDGYLCHLPRVWRMLERALGAPVLGDLRALLADLVPLGARGIPAGLGTGQS